MKIPCRFLLALSILCQQLPAELYSENPESVDERQEEPMSSSSGETDYTGSDYNLGRIIGPSPMYNILTFYWPEDNFALLDFFHTQTGVDNKFNFGGSAMGDLLVNNSNSLWMFSLPEFDFSCAAGPSNRIRGLIIPTNLVFLASRHESASGFEEPFYMQNTYQWDFLSHKGSIQVSPDQYDNAFYYRPLVNPGQVGINLSLSHSIGESADETYIGLVRSKMFVGLIDNMQLDIDAAFRKDKSDYYDYYGDYDYYDYPGFYENDSLQVGSALHFRSGNLVVFGRYSLKREWFGPRIINTHMISANGAYILGSSIGSVREIEGNWDGFFTQQMGKNQLFASIGLDYNIAPDKSASDYFGLGNSLKFGLLKTLTIGENFLLSHYEGGDPKVNLELTVHFMNIPHRTYGPSGASKFEYVFGLWPKQGQLRIDLTYKLPFNNDELSYGEPQPVLQLMSNDLLNGITMVENPFTYSSSFTSPFQNSSFDGNLNNHDLYFKILAGVAPKVILADIFEFRIDKINTFYYYDDAWGNPFESEDDSETKNNFIYTNNFMAAFGDPDRILFILSFNLFGQSDERINGKDKFDFLLGCELEAAF
jgi:hypothetical protein